MNTNEIVKSLAELQKNLENIESAKQQVLKVVDSSAELAQVIAAYKSNFEGLTSNIRKMLDEVKELNLNTVSDLAKQIDIFSNEAGKLEKASGNLATVIQNLGSLKDATEANQKEIIIQLNRFQNDNQKFIMDIQAVLTQNLDTQKKMTEAQQNELTTNLNKYHNDHQKLIRSIQEEYIDKFTELRKVIKTNRVIQICELLLILIAIFGFVWFKP